MVTLNFGTFPEMTVQDGFVSICKARLDVINRMLNNREPRVLSPSQWNLEKSCGSTQISSKISIGRLASISSKAKHATLSFSQQMMMLRL